MIHITLTHPNRETLELDLPIPISKLVRREVLAQLAYGRVENMEFKTPDADLNAGLSRCLPECQEGGKKGLCMLAYLLKHMDKQRLALLREHLPDRPCAPLELCRRARYFRDFYLDRDGQVNEYVVPLEQFHDFDYPEVVEELLHREYLNDLKTQRLTAGQLFEQVIELARSKGALAGCESILDYILPENHDKEKITKYEFDFQPLINYGCEGVYISCGLAGDTGNTDRNRLKAGTIKTLERSLDACRRMGELCGVLLHYESEYVNSHLDLFASEKEHDHTIARWLKRAMVEEALGVSCLEYISHQNTVGRLNIGQIYFVPELGEGQCDAKAFCVMEDRITTCPVWEPEGRPVQFSDRADGSIQYMRVSREDVDSGITLSDLLAKLQDSCNEFLRDGYPHSCPSFNVFDSLEQPVAVMTSTEQQGLVME